MEQLIAIPVSEYERLKASEKEMNKLRQAQIDKIQKEQEDIRLRQHVGMMESTFCAQSCMYGSDPYFWPV